MLLTADPKANFLAHEGELREALDRVLLSGRYILGPEVEAFEQEFAAYLGGGHCSGVANGTEAIEVALRAAGVEAGNRVITVANTVSATVAAIEQTGALPVFADIDPGTMLLSATALEELLCTKPGAFKALVVVHLYGNAADMPALLALCREHGLVLIEDCAQAHGASLGGRKLGTFGDLATFSFYPTKNLGALGDGGAVFTQDPALAKRVRLLREYGWAQRYVSEIPGRNSRLDELQAAVLRVKLRHLDTENQRRAALVSRYAAQLSGVSALKLPAQREGSIHAWHQYALRSSKRDALKAHLAQVDIAAAVLYPTPIHRQPAYARPHQSLPETEKACAEVLCLPCHPQLTEAEVDRVASEILRWSQP